MGPPPEAVDDASGSESYWGRLAVTTSVFIDCLDDRQNQIETKDDEYILRYAARDLLGELYAWTTAFNEVLEEWANRITTALHGQLKTRFESNQELHEQVLELAFDRDRVPYFSVNPGMMTFVLDCYSGVGELPERRGKDRADVQRLLNVNLRQVGNAFKHYFEEEDPREKRILEERVLHFLKEWDAKRTQEHSAALMELAAPNYDFSSKMTEYFRDYAPKMEYKRTQVKRQLEGMQWKEYIRDPATVRKFIRKVEGNFVISLTGIGGIGKTAMALELIRRSMDPAHTDEIEPFKFYVLLGTKTEEYRTIEPKRKMDGTFERHAAPDDKFTVTKFIGGGKNEFTEFITKLAVCNPELTRNSKPEEYEGLALDALKGSRILVLLDNFEDIEYAELKKDVKKSFYDFFSRYSEIPVEEKKSKILITTRMEGAGTAFEPVEMLNEEETSELLIARVRHLQETHGLVPKWNAISFAGELARDPKRFSVIEDGDLRSRAEGAWAHPLIILYVAYKLVSSERPEYDENLLGEAWKPPQVRFDRTSGRGAYPLQPQKATKNANYSMVRDEIIRSLFKRLDDLVIKDLTKWVMEDAVGSLDEKLIPLLKMFVKTGETISATKLTTLYREEYNRELQAHEANKFMSVLESSSIAKQKDGREYKFNKQSLGFLRDLWDIPSPGKEPFRYKVNRTDEEKIAELILKIEDLPQFNAGTEGMYSDVVKSYRKILDHYFKQKRTVRVYEHLTALDNVAKVLLGKIDG